MNLGKKLVLLSAVAVSMLAAESKYDYEFTPVAGVVIPEGNIGVENEKVIGAQFQFNNIKLFDMIKPQVALLYSPSTDYEDYNNVDTTFTRVLLNGVYEYDSIDKITPYALAGAGWEHMSYAIDGNYNNSYVLDAGVGIKYALSEDFALKLEALYMLKNNVNRWDSNLGLLAGITYSFGQKAPAPAPKPLDSDNDGVVDSQDNCPATPANTKVDADGCELDSDKDGVVDSQDKCPNSTVDAKVDESGCEIIKACPVKIDLKLNFETNSYKLDEASKVKVAEFAEFLKCSQEYTVTIVGHTDSRGTHKYNQTLSKNRAEATKAALIADGVDASRIDTLGKSFDEPVATNATKDGRAKNRRIIAIFNK
jgi:OOP family OmpA-OmpF porin